MKWAGIQTSTPHHINDRRRRNSSTFDIKSLVGGNSSQVGGDNSRRVFKRTSLVALSDRRKKLPPFEIKF